MEKMNKILALLCVLLSGLTMRGQANASVPTVDENRPVGMAGEVCRALSDTLSAAVCGDATASSTCAEDTGSREFRTFHDQGGVQVFTVLFRPDRPIVEDDCWDTIRHIASLLKNNPTAYVTLYGYYEPDDRRQQRISVQRTKLLKSLLVIEFGICAHRIEREVVMQPSEEETTLWKQALVCIVEE